VRATTRRFILRILVPAWLVLLVVAAGGGVLSGVLADREPRGPTHADVALERYGEPRAFWLVDDPGTPGEDDDLRVEQWLYPEAGVVLTFCDGRLVGEQEVTFTQELVQTPISPTTLSRRMRRDEVEKLLSEQGEPLAGVKSPYPELRAYQYPRSRLLVGYLDDRLFTAQVY
jgi:hypothetical protein